MKQSERPDLDRIVEKAKEIADWVFDSQPPYPALVERLKIIMELYWYRGRDRVE